MKISRDHKIYSMGPGNKPTAYVNCKDVIIVETSDCYDGMVVSEIDEENTIEKERINPATGPIYVEGAEPGDTLIVDILDIKLQGRGIMRISPEFGTLREMVDRSKFKLLNVSDGIIHFSKYIKIPVKPMVGVIGTSPSKVVIDNETPGDHGANMDTTDITTGTRVYLPVFVEGGLLALGDIHASMGDGESSGTGVEIGGEVTIKVDVIKHTGQKRPYIETDRAFYTVCTAVTLEEASKLAVKDGTNLIMEKLGLDFDDAYMLTSVGCNLIISQIVNPLMTVRLQIPKAMLGMENIMCC